MTTTWPSAPLPVVPPGRLPPQPSPSRVKVLHVTTRFAGGSGGNVLLSAVGMDPRMYEVWIAGSVGGPLWQEATGRGIRTVELPRFREVISPLGDLIVLWQLIRLMRRERFSVVHTHSAKGGVLGRLAARRCRIPVVVHTFHAFSFHDFMRSSRRRLYLFLERLVRKATHAFVAVAPQVAREAVEHRLAPPGSVRVIPSSVHIEDIPQTARASVRGELGLDGDVRIVGTVGRLVFQKAPLDFVRMAALVAERHPEARFVWVGDASFNGSLEGSSLEERTRDEAQRLGVDIRFTGFRTDAAALTACFDVFVITSLYEGLGRSLTEAMAAARPVVATAVNGVPDLVEPGSTGLLAPPSDPASMADCVSWLLEHPEEARRMGRAGRDRVLRTFRPEVMCEGLDRLYRDLLGLPQAQRVTETPSVDVPEVSGDGKEGVLPHAG
jgi:glycosyltransferase involved in cell wall biosynthesis